MNRQLKLLMLAVIVGVIIIVGYNFTQRRVMPLQPQILKEGIYQLGALVIDTTNAEIQFKAKIQKREGWVQHLIYLHGYKWLKEKSAIISEVNLINLQKAIFILDWKLWDELWREKVTERVEERELLLFVKWGEEEIAAQELVLTEDKLEIKDFIFLGSPYFDHIVLKTSPCVKCKFCPIFSLEKTFKENFIRESGQSGYELNSERMPPQGAEVSIIIRLSK